MLFEIIVLVVMLATLALAMGIVMLLIYNVKCFRNYIREEIDRIDREEESY